VGERLKNNNDPSHRALKSTRTPRQTLSLASASTVTNKSKIANMASIFTAIAGKLGLTKTKIFEGSFDKAGVDFYSLS